MLRPMKHTVRLASSALPVGALLALLVCLAAPAGAAECTTSAAPAEIGPEEAQRLYDCIESALVETYRDIEGVPGVPDYRGWAVVSSTPFISSTHGHDVINHIANPAARPLYTRWEGMQGRTMPVGAILAKESFEVTDSGAVEVGPLSLMEKAPPGTSPDTEDWIYTRIYPDGRVQRTGAAGGQYLDFCHDCHSATADHFDALFFPPEKSRISTE